MYSPNVFSNIQLQYSVNVFSKCIQQMYVENVFGKCFQYAHYSRARYDRIDMKAIFYSRTYYLCARSLGINRMYGSFIVYIKN